MRNKKLLWCMVLVFLAGFLRPINDVQAQPVQSSTVTAYDLILAMNTLRTSNGLPALIEDPIVNAVAQTTADIMAANQMSWHIGNVRGRLAAAGYGGGGTVWGTENFAVGNMSVDEIMVAWSDPDHMRPATIAAYCHVGAGVATASNGMTYYVLQAAYTSEKACGEYTSPPGTTPRPGGGAPPQIIVPVKISTPDADGKIYHIVQAGQSFWAIAITYQITIRDLEIWNNLSRDTPLQTGQRLFIPGKNTAGYATPTPVGMIVPATPDADGKIIHIVQPYNALLTIADTYNVTVERILFLNGLQEDWPLQIGQKLLIYPGNITPSPTPRPLTPIEKLTPASDGTYYHTVHSGETLSWIADLYDVSLADLMAWNSLSASSIIRPDQQLILQVTPPVTSTYTPAPPTDTPQPTTTPTPPRPTDSPTLPATMPPDSTAMVAAGSPPGGFGVGLIIFAVAVMLGLLVWVVVARKKPASP
jgi:LysM repeat protein